MKYVWIVTYSVIESYGGGIVGVFDNEVDARYFKDLEEHEAERDILADFDVERWPVQFVPD